MINNQNIMKTITIYIPGNACNMRCEYCYNTECFKYERNTTPARFATSVENMIYAFRPERIGGLAHIVVIGNGETLIPPETVPLCKGLLKHGHIVEVVTNGSLTNRIDELIDCDMDCLSRLIVKCSLHWNELKRLNLMDAYFSNIKKVLAAGASSYPFLVVGKAYQESLDEIRKKCLEELSELPHCTPCVVADSYEEMVNGDLYRTDPPCTEEFVKDIMDKFDSELFRQSVRFLDIDVKNVFCYAGKWSFGVALASGAVLKCHNSMAGFNFFENLEEKMPEIEPICNSCGLTSCALQYDMFAMGLIPEVENVPTYSEMMCKKSVFFTDTVRNMMDFKLCDRHHRMTDEEERAFLFKKITELNKEKALLSQEESTPDKAKKVLNVIENNSDDYNEYSKISYSDVAAFFVTLDSLKVAQDEALGLFSKFVDKVISMQKYMGINYVFDSAREICNLPASMIPCYVKDIDDVDELIEKRDIFRLAAVLRLYALECVK